MARSEQIDPAIHETLNVSACKNRCKKKTPHSVGWQSFVGPRIAVIGVDTFGSSAPGPVVMRHYGFTVENVCRQAHRVLEKPKEKAPCASESPQTMEGSF